MIHHVKQLVDPYNIGFRYNFVCTKQHTRIKQSRLYRGTYQSTSKPTQQTNETQHAIKQHCAVPVEKITEQQPELIQTIKTSPSAIDSRVQTHRQKPTTSDYSSSIDTVVQNARVTTLPNLDCSFFLSEKAIQKSQYTCERILQLTQTKNEIGWLYTGTVKKSTTVQGKSHLEICAEDIYIPEDQGISRVSYQIDGSRQAIINDSLRQQNKRIVGIGHSHNVMKIFHSEVDIKNVQTLPYTIGISVNDSVVLPSLIFNAIRDPFESKISQIRQSTWDLHSLYINPIELSPQFHQPLVYKPLNEAQPVSTQRMTTSQVTAPQKQAKTDYVSLDTRFTDRYQTATSFSLVSEEEKVAIDTSICRVLYRNKCDINYHALGSHKDKILSILKDEDNYHRSLS
jgi:proteasome lid subunit RPN8/RPN11